MYIFFYIIFVFYFAMLKTKSIYYVCVCVSVCEKDQHSRETTGGWFQSGLTNFSHGHNYWHPWIVITALRTSNRKKKINESACKLDSFAASNLIWKCIKLLRCIISSETCTLSFTMNFKMKPSCPWRNACQSICWSCMLGWCSATTSTDFSS